MLLTSTHDYRGILRSHSRPDQPISHSLEPVHASHAARAIFLGLTITSIHPLSLTYTHRALQPHYRLDTSSPNPSPCLPSPHANVHPTPLPRSQPVFPSNHLSKYSTLTLTTS
ncbi:hypothetical protein LIA77_03720 [Sarocladium implicatum]|nr:hypothetical protein LIA77_03720 [Sarocladium implicatum]